VNRSGPLVVVGDALLDRDLHGSVQRIAPDAPAPVFEETDGRERPGGAGLAAVLAVGHGRPVRLITAIGCDPAGDRLRKLLAAAGVEVVAVPYQGATPEKVRVCVDGQVLLRMDRGTAPGQLSDPDGGLREAFIDAAAILVSDYGRGVTRLDSVREAVGGLVSSRPVVWDPHPRGGQPVPGVQLVTPNESELDGVDPSRRLPSITEAAGRARERWRAHAVAVTLGAEGALLAHGGSTPMAVPVPLAVPAGSDTCGAGDRFAAAATAALADGALLSEAVQAAVADAAMFVARGAARGYGAPTGPARAPAEVGMEAALVVAAATRSRGGTVVATGGCFDLLHAGHVATLEAARALGDCLIVCLNSDHSVRRLKGPDRPLVAQHDRARLVAALGCVDAVVIFDDTTPGPVLTTLRPDIWVKGGDYFLNDPHEHDPDSQPALPEAELMHTWGGQSLVVPYLAGHSTTELIDTARIRGASPVPTSPALTGREGRST
jgi:rfaE bifunctional protein nucleotidyltransferase chain/domain/rfaE bifunctional protein kinase chain/domain